MGLAFRNILRFYERDALGTVPWVYDVRGLCESAYANVTTGSIDGIPTVAFAGNAVVGPLVDGLYHVRWKLISRAQVTAGIFWQYGIRKTGVAFGTGSGTVNYRMIMQAGREHVHEENLFLVGGPPVIPPPRDNVYISNESALAIGDNFDFQITITPLLL